MKKAVFTFTLLGVATILLLVSAPQVFAVNYTAIPDKTVEKPAKKKTQNYKPRKKICTSEDRSNIKSYERYLKKYEKDVDDAYNKLGKDSQRAEKRLAKKIKKFTDFVESDKMKAIRQSYDNCNKIMPLGPYSKPFWTL